MTSVLNDPKLERLIARLQKRSREQERVMGKYFRDLSRKVAKSQRPAAIKRYLSDKMVALEPAKAEFCYQLCRALKPTRIVEIGTSYGVSTLYLAAALRDNARKGWKHGVVIGTEYEPNKARAARTNFARAGLSKFIELREGDLRDTLLDLKGPVDFVLIDTWLEAVRPALELVAPTLHPGSVIVCDNTESFRKPYQIYFDFIARPANRFRTLTLPFSGGLEMTVRV